jgi:hypothetical protein
MKALILLLALFFTTTGPNAGGTFAGWTNSSNAGAEDGAEATISTYTDDTPSLSLRVTNFGFAVPAGATINGVTVEVKRRKTNDLGFSTKDANVNLTKNGTAAVGTNKASATNWTTTLTFATYGGAADLWGTTWTATEINASTFGVLLKVYDPIGGGGETANVDFIRVTVDFTAAAGPAQSQKQTGFYMPPTE